MRAGRPARGAARRLGRGLAGALALVAAIALARSRLAPEWRAGFAGLERADLASPATRSRAGAPRQGWAPLDAAVRADGRRELCRITLRR